MKLKHPEEHARQAVERVAAAGEQMEELRTHLMRLAAVAIAAGAPERVVGEVATLRRWFTSTEVRGVPRGES